VHHVAAAGVIINKTITVVSERVPICYCEVYEETLMVKKGENIYKRKDGRWEGRCFVLFRSRDHPAGLFYTYIR